MQALVWESVRSFDVPHKMAAVCEDSRMLARTEHVPMFGGPRPKNETAGERLRSCRVLGDGDLSAARIGARRADDQCFAGVRRSGRARILWTKHPRSVAAR
jgi:hypothetical protein